MNMGKVFKKPTPCFRKTQLPPRGSVLLEQLYPQGLSPGAPRALPFGRGKPAGTSGLISCPSADTIEQLHWEMGWDAAESNWNRWGRARRENQPKDKPRHVQHLKVSL